MRKGIFQAFILLLLVFFLTSCATPKEKSSKETYSHGVLKKKITRQGSEVITLEYYPDGTLQRKTVKSGQRYRILEFYPTGILKKEEKLQMVSGLHSLNLE